MAVYRNKDRRKHSSVSHYVDEAEYVAKRHHHRLHHNEIPTSSTSTTSTNGKFNKNVPVSNPEQLKKRTYIKRIIYRRLSDRKRTEDDIEAKNNLENIEVAYGVSEFFDTPSQSEQYHRKSVSHDDTNVKTIRKEKKTIKKKRKYKVEKSRADKKNNNNNSKTSTEKSNKKSGKKSEENSSSSAQSRSKNAYIKKFSKAFSLAKSAVSDNSVNQNESMGANIMNRISGSKGEVAVGMFSSVMLAPILVVLVVLLVLVMFLFRLKPSDNLLPLKDTVYLTNQNYKAELISEKSELFGLEDVTVNYRGMSVSWKQIICYWYVYGCDVGYGDETVPVFTEGMDPDTVKDCVTSTVLSKTEMDKLTECFNALNVIISYPESSIVNYERIDAKLMSSDDINSYVTEQGFLFDEDTNELYKPIYEKSLAVNIERTEAFEAAKANWKNAENIDYILDHIDRCIRAVEENDSSLEPVFYNLWAAIRDETNITVNGRDLIAKEGFAIWFMTGCKGGNVFDNIPSSLYLDYFEPYDNDGDKRDDVYRFDYVFYRKSGSEDKPWRFHFEIPIDNPNVENACKKYGIPTVNENDIVPFLNPDNGSGWYCYYDPTNDTYDFSILQDGTTSFDYMNCSWQDYSYRCIGSNASGAWCDAFVNSLSQNMYPNGCFFTYNKFFIDWEHAGWEEWNPKEQDWDDSTDWEEATRCFDGVNVLNFMGKVSDFLSSMGNHLSAIDTISFLNEVHLTAETDYYRINLTSSYSSMTVGLESRYTQDGAIFRPSDEDSYEYRPDEKDLAFLYSSETDSFGNQLNESSSDIIYDSETGLVPLPYHDGSMNYGFVTNAGVDNSAYHIGHKKGWYAPMFKVNSEFGEDMDLDRLYMIMGIKIYAAVYNWDETFVNWCTGLGDSVSDWWNINIANNIEATEGMSMGDYLNKQNQINRLMYYNCGLFGEVMEETQGLFGNYSFCPYNLSWYDSLGWSYSSSDIGDLTDIEVGDVVFYDWGDIDKAGNYVPDGTVDHVGLVIGIDGSMVYVIEGNKESSVGLRMLDYKSYQCAAAYIDIDYGADDK